MSRHRKLGLSGVALVKARIRNDVAALTDVRDRLESLIIRSHWFPGPPFEWITIAIRYGLKNEDEPHFGRISKRYGDLPLSIELDTHDLLEADKKQQWLSDLFEGAALKALSAVATRYNLPNDVLANYIRSKNAA